MVRLFVAVPLEADVRMRLAMLAGGIPGARWVPAENMHLTLRFIGDVEEARLEELDLALGWVEAPSFEISLEGVGQFATGRKPRAVWVGVPRSEALLHLQAKVDSALVRVGVGPEERKFKPHVTLARLKDAPSQRVGRFLETHGLFRAGPVRVDRFVLYESHTGRDGPVYHPLRAYPLVGSED